MNSCLCILTFWGGEFRMQTLPEIQNYLLTFMPFHFRKITRDLLARIRKSEVQPKPVQHPQDTRPGCRLRWRSWLNHQLEETNAVHQSAGARQLPAHPAGQVWLCARLPDSLEKHSRFSDWRHGESSCYKRKEDGQLQRPCCDTRKRQLQYPDPHWFGSRCITPLLHGSAARGRIRLFTGSKNGRDRYAAKGNGCFASTLYLPGMNAGVSREI